MPTTVEKPYSQFVDTDGDPLENGYIYIGTSGLNPEIPANQLSVYSDKARTVPVSQPVRTLGGRPVNNSGAPINIQISESDYSISVKNKNGSLISNTLSVQNIIDSFNLLFTQSGTGAIVRSVQDKLREYVSVKDFGATGDGVTDDLAAIQAALNSVSVSGKTVFFPAGTYLVSDSVVFPDGVSVKGESMRRSTIKGTGLTNKSVIRTTYGEAPTYAERTFNWDIKDLTILGDNAVGSIGLNWGNVGYANLENVFIQDFETGFKATQRAYYNFFINLTIQNCTTCASLQSDGGANEFLNANFAFLDIGVDILEGAWGFTGGAIDTGTVGATAFIKCGENSRAKSATLYISNLYVEGVDAATTSIHFYDNSLGCGIFGLQRRNVTGPIVYETSTNPTLGTKATEQVFVSGFALTSATHNSVTYVLRESLSNDAIRAGLTAVEAGTAQIVGSSLTSAGNLSVENLFVGGGASGAFGLYNSSAAPEGVVSAPASSLCFVNTGGGTGASGTLYVKNGGTGNTNWGALLSASANATTTQLTDITDAINTSGKSDGKVVLNVTTGVFVVANGAAAGDTWKTLAGNVAHTPV